MHSPGCKKLHKLPPLTALCYQDPSDKQSVYSAYDALIARHSDAIGPFASCLQRLHDSRVHYLHRSGDRLSLVVNDIRTEGFAFAFNERLALGRTWRSFLFPLHISFNSLKSLEFYTLSQTRAVTANALAHAAQLSV